MKVSGGEKQRLSIARRSSVGPQLLVFDEATSSLDSLTEEGIVETIRDVAEQARRDHRHDRSPAYRLFCTPTASTFWNGAASSKPAATTS